MKTIDKAMTVIEVKMIEKRLNYLIEQMESGEGIHNTIILKGALEGIEKIKVMLSEEE